MEKFLETHDVVNLILNNLVSKDLKEYKGGFYIDKIKFKKIKLNKDKTITVSVETEYGLINKELNKIKKVKKQQDILYPYFVKFTDYLISEFKLKIENIDFLTIDNVFNTIGHQEILNCLNLMSNIYDETKNNIYDIKINDNLYYIEGDNLIKEALTLYKVEIKKGSLTRDEITLSLKKMDKKLNEYVNFYLDKGFEPEIAMNKAKNTLSKFSLMRIGDTKGNSKLIITSKQPIDLNKENKEITKIDLLIFTNYFIKYKNKEIKTKKELEDIIYLTNKVVKGG